MPIVLAQMYLCSSLLTNVLTGEISGDEVVFVF